MSTSRHNFLFVSFHPSGVMTVDKPPRSSPTPRRTGGTIGVSSQSGAGSAIIGSGADVAGIGGFSGRESQVSARWLAQAVLDERLRWILPNAQSGMFGGGGRGDDGRVGARDAIALVQRTCKPVRVSGTTVYDCKSFGDAVLAVS